MKKRIITILTCILLACFSSFIFTACNNNDAGENNQDSEIKLIYNTYVAEMQESGNTPLSYEEWLESIKGEKGDKGDDGAPGKDGKDGADGKDGKDGVDGVTPTIEISNDGYWVINGTKTEYKAIGVDGTNGTNGTDGKDGADGKDGQDGKDGVTPTIEISNDGYWVINGTKTEYKAIGVDGTNGTNGTDGKDGQDGINGTNGKDGATIKSVEFDEQGRLVITLTDGTVLDPVELPKKEEHVHEFGELIVYTQGEMSCEDRIFYCVCKTCNQIEWKKGSYNDHAWSKSIIEPTCTSQGYVHQTCTICGKEEDVDFTPVLEHNWQGEYVIDKLCHWYKCNDCDAVKDKVEHTIDDSGYCTICNGAVGSTVGIIYDLSGDGTYYEVIGYEGTAKNIIIASEYNQKPVKAIYNGAFADTNIASVIIPDSVLSIGSSAFHDCDSLTSVTIPDSVTNIGSNAFSWSDYLINVIIGNGVTSIGHQVFYSCDRLGNVIIGNGVTSIAYDAFESCGSLSITIPDSVTSIADHAFEYSYVEKVNYLGNIDSWVVKGFAEKINGTYDLYINDKLVTEANITTATKISDYAFYKCKSITSVTMPDSVLSIGDYAFYGCYNLTSITIGDGVTSIGYDAFGRCSNLTSVTIGESVTSIGDYAFYSCSNLTSVTIGDSVTSIGSYVFYDCNEALYTVENNLKYVKANGNNYCILIEATNKNLSTYQINENTKHIANGVFSSCKRLSSITIPNSVLSVGDTAFQYCDSLTDVYYNGTKEDWAKINIGSSNTKLKNATIHYLTQE